jgi:hypothetical protein
MLCSKLHCKKGFDKILFSPRILSNAVEFQPTFTRLSGGKRTRRLLSGWDQIQFHAETLTIYKLSPRKVTTHNNVY